MSALRQDAAVLRQDAGIVRERLNDSVLSSAPHTGAHLIARRGRWELDQALLAWDYGEASNGELDEAIDVAYDDLERIRWARERREHGCCEACGWVHPSAYDCLDADPDDPPPEWTMRSGYDLGDRGRPALVLLRLRVSDLGVCLADTEHPALRRLGEALVGSVRWLVAIAQEAADNDTDRQEDNRYGT